MKQPSLPGSCGLINPHAVLISRGFVISWFQIKCIVAHKHQNANSSWHILLISLVMASTCARSWWKDLPHFHFIWSCVVYNPPTMGFGLVWSDFFWMIISKHHLIMNEIIYIYFTHSYSLFPTVPCFGPNVLQRFSCSHYRLWHYERGIFFSMKHLLINDLILSNS